MPIAATQSSLESGILSALKMGPAAVPPTVATMITTAMASSSSAGQFPIGTGTIPTTPVGFSATQSLMTTAFTLGPVAKPEIVAPIMASAIVALAPVFPPVGLSTLQSSILSALKKGQAATEEIIAKELASAFITYYIAGGVL